jgi:hypothetical protein
MALPIPRAAPVTMQDAPRQPAHAHLPVTWQTQQDRSGRGARRPEKKFHEAQKTGLVKSSMLSWVIFGVSK